MAYAFPPLNLILSVLQKAKKEHTTPVLVAPLWCHQHTILARFFASELIVATWESVYPKFTDESLSSYLPDRPSTQSRQDWRAINKDKPRLFLSIKKPHKPVSFSTLSRWIKEIIFWSGIKDLCFKGHSVRSASTSAARASGLSINTIISMADWTNESTFKKFYYRPSLPVTYGTAFLSNSS